LAQDVKTDKLIGQTLEGKYKIQALIARGGMAKVYKSLQTNLNRNVAIKVLDPKHVDADDPEFRKRFELEAQMTSQLNHPNTVTIHDYGFNEKLDVFYFVMEFIDGKTLRREMKQEGEFPVDRALHISQQIARSVRQAHSVGVVHRDLKPSNVLLTTHDEDRDWVKVVDFGLLKLRKESVAESSKGVLMGSPRYMSPEQIKRGELDHRTDVYSLGVNLYQMLSGRAPFVGQRAMDVLMGHINSPPPPLSSLTGRDDVPAEVEAFVMTLLAKKPDERPDDMEEVIEVLGRLRKQVRASIPPAARAAPLQPIPQTASSPGEEIPPGSSAPTQWSDTVPASELAPVTGAAPVLQPQDTGVQEAPSRKGMWVAIASILVLLMGGGAIAVIFSMDLGLTKKKPKIQRASVAGEVKPTPGVDEVEEAPEETTPAIQTFKVRFATDPEGADVFEGDAALCTTPCETDWIVVEGEGEPRTFTLIKEGHENLEVVEEIPASDIDVDVILTPVKKAGKKPAVKVHSKGLKKPPKSDTSTGDDSQGKKKKKALGLDEEFPE
jgi:serine/threonine-protein kinase